VEQKPTLENGLSLVGLDVQLVWYQSQEARNRDEAPELISSLQIDACEKVCVSDVLGADCWEGLPELAVYRCQGRLAQCIDVRTRYGAWLRMQESPQSYPDDLLYDEVPINVTLVLGQATKPVIRAVQPRLLIVQPTLLVPQRINVFDAAISDETIDALTDLQVDRAFECLTALRILIPRLSMDAKAEGAARLGLERKLRAVEAEELATAEELRQLSAQTVAAWQALQACRERLQANENAVASEKALAEARLKEDSRCLLKARQEQSRLQGVLRAAEQRALQAHRDKISSDTNRHRSAAETAQQTLTRIRSELATLERAVARSERLVCQAGVQYRAAQAALHAAVSDAEKAFHAALRAEEPVSKKFEFAFLRREEILADLDT
ncbi:MAG: hypothetical protein KDD69_12560, partial [Bdellovibrionales bacterium]|nr:hypothetical protein [Bdellovibrionales bacterium]